MSPSMLKTPSVTTQIAPVTSGFARAAASFARRSPRSECRYTPLCRPFLMTAARRMPSMIDAWFSSSLITRSPGSHSVGKIASFAFQQLVKV